MSYGSEPIDTNRRRALRMALCGGMLALPVWPLAQAQSAAEPVQPFDAAIWARIRQTGPRPAAYVFTTTYCSTCPAVFELLAETIRDAGQRIELAAIIMDAQGQRALAHAHHYQGITRLYAFNGFEAEIRQAVDPKWRNVTPYVALLGRATDQRVIGPPSAIQLKNWLG